MNEPEAVAELLSRAGFSANVNCLWAAATVLRLQRLGVTRFVVSPGSRNTPFVYALAELPGHQVEVVVDERSAGFVALGWSKAAGKKPVALVCTSGSALSHYFPALIEASYTRTPLVVLSADRPPELQNCHAGQTINQRGVFGRYVGGEYTAPVPSIAGWDGVLLPLNQLCEHWKGAIRSSVHFNQPFRDPLTPGMRDEGGPVSGHMLSKWAKEICRPVRHFPKLVSSEYRIPSARRLLVIFGPDEGACAEGDAILEQIRRMPEGHAVFLSDGLSRFRWAIDRSVASYDLFLRSPEVVEALEPDQIWLFGDLPTSKPLRAALAAWGAPVISYQNDADLRHAGLEIPWQALPLGALALNVESTTPAVSEFFDGWHEHELRFQARIEAAQHATGLVEWQLPRLLLESAPENVRFMIASSMPVRDWEAFAPAVGTVRQVFTNRGANGIDGLISTAAGLALEDPLAPVWLVIGDVATSHDMGGLASAARCPGILKVLVINNAGGRIFDFLPISGVSMDFQRFYHTRPGLDFEALAAAVGISYACPATRDGLVEALASRSCKQLVEIRVNPESDQAERRALTDPKN